MPSPFPDSGPRSGFALALLVTLALAPQMFRLPPVDRDESRFARGARETLAMPAETWWLPVLDGRPRLDKPPLAAWAQMAAVAMSGDAGAWRPAIAPHRWPSLLAAIAAAIATWRLGLRFLSPAGAWFAGALFAAAPLLLWEGAQARADLLLVAGTTMALACLAPAALEPGSAKLSLPRALAGWSALALASLAKGPIAWLVVLPPLLLAPPRGTRNPGRLRPLLGLVVAAIFAAPWLLALDSEALGAELAGTAWRELPMRALAAREGHFAPPGLHLLLATVLYWPASLGFPLAAVATWRGWRAGDRVARFLAFWIAPAWLLFELSATKLPHYTLPLAPALALAATRVLFDAECAGHSPLTAGGGRRWARALAALWRWGTLIVPAALLAALAVPLGGAARTLAGAFALLALALHLSTAARWRAGHPIGPLAAAMVLSFIGSILALGVLLPARAELWLSPRTADALFAIDPGGVRPLAISGWREESLIFATAGRAELVPGERATAWLRGHEAGLLVHDAELPRDAATTLAELRGYDYVKGSWRTLWISEARRAPPAQLVKPAPR